MRDVSPDLAAAIGAADRITHTLFWLTARDYSTGDLHNFGFSTLVEDLTLTVEGEERVYFGAGAVLSTPPLVAQVGLTVRAHEITLSAIPPEVALAVRGYDLERQPVQIHTAFFDPETNAYLGAQRDFPGVVDTVSIDEAPPPGPAKVSITFLSANHQLAAGLPMMRNDATQRAAFPGDRFFRYSDMVGVTEPWGEKRASGPSAPAAPRPAFSEEDRAGLF